MKKHIKIIAISIITAICLFIGSGLWHVAYDAYQHPLKVNDILITDADQFGYDKYDFSDPFTKDPVVGTDIYKIINLKDGYCQYEHTEISCTYIRKYVIVDGVVSSNHKTTQI